MHRKFSTILFHAFLVCLLSVPMTACSRSAPTEAPPAETAPFTDAGLHFSVPGGFYDQGFDLVMTADDGAEIYYTLDGSIPTVSSTRYQSPIPVTDRSDDENVLSAHTDIAQPAAYAGKFVPRKPVPKATVVRAAAMDSNGTLRPVVNAAYFIGFDQKAAYYQDRKILSLLMDARDLFDYETGIYVLGKAYDDWKNGADYDPSTPDFFMPANYTQKGREWERTAALQIFDDQQFAAELDVGIRIHGGATRSYPQKSLNVYTRKDYGSPKLAYDLFSGNLHTQTDGSPITEVDGFVLRNGGNDALYTRFSDKLVQSLSSDCQFLTQGMEPCIVFINGEFWGQYEITEKLDESFVGAHYGIPAKNICIIKAEELEEGSEETFAAWKQLRQWIRDTDLSDQDAYDKLCDSVDMQGFMDYVSTEIYISNADWGKANMAMWRAETPDASSDHADGKWRFILYDTEYSAGIYGQAQPSENSFEKLMSSDCFLADLFCGALENAGFREQFRDTFLRIADKNFDSAHVDAEIGRLSEMYHDMTIDTYDRFWGRVRGGYGAETNYRDAVDSLRSFYAQRREYIVPYLEQCIRDAAAPEN